MSFGRDFTKGIWAENPVFVLLLGLCPTLAVTSTLKNGVGMALAATFVLVCCNIIISLLRRVIPAQIRIPCFIVIIATFVTILQIIMKAYLPDLNKALGIFIPLIVVNCIILGRAEAFASKKPVLPSIADALGIGLGFLVALCIISGIREILGSGALWDIPFIKWEKAVAVMQPVNVFAQAPGAFIVLGLLLGLFQWARNRRNARRLASLTRGEE